MSVVAKKRSAASSDAVLTADQVAERLHVSRRQVVRWMDERKIKFVQLPQGRRILESELMAWLEQRSISAA